MDDNVLEIKEEDESRVGDSRFSSQDEYYAYRCGCSDSESETEFSVGKPLGAQVAPPMAAGRANPRPHSYPPTTTNSSATSGLSFSRPTPSPVKPVLEKGNFFSKANQLYKRTSPKYYNSMPSFARLL